MRERDNCIDFDDTMAQVFDDTRRFSTIHLNVVTEVCRELIKRYGNADSNIELLDVGAGTGRLTFAIAHHYEMLNTNTSEIPHLKITCVDRSPHMVNVLKHKLSTFQGNRVSIEIQETGDIRDLRPLKTPFHAVVAHWVFHVISDWRIAVYVIDKLIRNDGILFLFEERSPLYDAIDDNLTGIKGHKTKEFWQAYHRQREEIASTLARNGLTLPARYRLGSMVIDIRVERMFEALGWNAPVALGYTDKWECKFSISDIIEKMIRTRAFTNMRLYADDVSSNVEYQKMADHLKGEFSPYLGVKENYETTFTAKYMTPKDDRSAHKGWDTVIHQVARATLGRRWVRRLDYSYNRDALWSRLFESSWERLWPSEVGTNISGKYQNDFNNIIWTFASTPFKITSSEGRKYKWPTAQSFLEQYGPDCWNELTQNIETDDPFVIWFEAETCDEDYDDGNLPDRQRIHPPLHVIEVSVNMQKSLHEIEGLTKNNGESQQWSEARYKAQQLIDSDQEVGKIIRSAREYGILPYRKGVADANFVVALSKLGKIQDLRGLYVFPFPSFISNRRGVYGLMVGVSKALTTRGWNFLWSLADIIFNEYLEDLIGESEATELIREVKPIVRTSARIPQKVTPAVLIVTAPDVEYVTMLELAGIDKKTLESRTLIKGGQVCINLGFGGICICGIKCPSKASVSPGGSQETLDAVLKTLEKPPIAVILTGIACGLRRSEQQLGDIIISNTIKQCDPRRIGKDKTTYGAGEPYASQILKGWFESFYHSWHTECTKRPNLHTGLLLTGDALVDKKTLVAELIDAHDRRPVGYEMEAGGVFTAITEFERLKRVKVDWLVVKGISDWGTGKHDVSDEIHDRYQKVAAQNAIDLVFHILGRGVVQKAIKNR